jgi:DNA polymerase III subunit beta
MEVTLNKKDLVALLGQLTNVAEKKNTIPILANLRLRAEGAQLVADATDLDVAMQDAIAGEVGRPGQACVNAKKLFEIVKSLPTEAVTLTGTDDHLRVQSGRAKFKLHAVPVESFPEAPTTTLPDPVKLKAGELALLIKSVDFTITNQESRYALHGALLELHPTKLRLVGTDGHRLACRDLPGNFAVAEMRKVLVPRKGLDMLARMCEGSDEVAIGWAENHFLAQAANRVLQARILTGQFPSYDMVLPQDKRISALIERERLLVTLKRVALLADEKSYSIKFDFAADVLKLSAQTIELGEGEDYVPIKYAGSPVTTAFNAHFWLEFLQVCGAKEVELRLATQDPGGKQVEARAADDDEGLWRYIVMPMRA